MKKKLVALLAIITVAACLMLSACSLGTAGTYKFKSVSYEGITIEAGGDFLGMTLNADSIVLELKKDKTFVMTSFGNESKGTWEKKGKEITLTEDDYTVTMTVDGKTLTSEEDGSKFVLEKA